MKNRILLSGIALLLLFVTPQAAFATSWAYPFVVWNDSIYVVTDEVVTEVEKEVGKVTSYSDMEQKGGNFSNHFPKGTTYFAIKGISTNEAIAIESENGQYVKAVYEGEYTYLGNVWDKLRMAFMAVVIAIIAFIMYYIVPSFKNKT